MYLFQPRGMDDDLLLSLAFVGHEMTVFDANMLHNQES